MATVIDNFHGDNSFLSNFYESPFWYKGLLWPTVEHAYQAEKCLYSSDKQGCVAVATPRRNSSPTCKAEVGVSLRYLDE